MSARSARPRRGDDAVIALMRLVHRIEAANQDRPSSDLDLRARMVLQDLGLQGAVPIVDVRARLGVSPSTMTSLVDRLEGRGYLTRQAHPTNRRVTVLALTARGKQAFRGELEFYRQLVAQTLAPLGEPARRMILAALAQSPPDR